MDNLCECGYICDCNCCNPLQACLCGPKCKCGCPCANEDMPMNKLSLSSKHIDLRAIANRIAKTAGVSSVSDICKQIMTIAQNDFVSYGEVLDKIQTELEKKYGKRSK